LGLHRGRAQIADAAVHPAGGDCRWSSYRTHAQGAAGTLLTGHDLYGRQGGGPAEWQTAYRALLRAALDEALVDSLHAATDGGG
jgi:hypothetical protein